MQHLLVWKYCSTYKMDTFFCILRLAMIQYVSYPINKGGDRMLRMEIALFLVLGFVAYMYFSAEKKESQLHKTFSVLLVVMLFHLVFDGITVYTVNHLETVPTLLNDIFHRLFIGTMIFVFFLFYQYIAILVEEETGKPRRLDPAARVYLVIAELGDILLPIHYAVTPAGNYSDGMDDLDRFS